MAGGLLDVWAVEVDVARMVCCGCCCCDGEVVGTACCDGGEAVKEDGGCGGVEEGKVSGSCFAGDEAGGKMMGDEEAVSLLLVCKLGEVFLVCLLLGVVVHASGTALKPDVLLQ